MTFVEAKASKKYARPLGARGNSKYIVLVTPEIEDDFDRYMSHVYQSFPKVEDEDAVPYCRDGRFRLKAFSFEDNHLSIFDCEIDSH